MKGIIKTFLHLHHFLFSRETCIDRAYIDDKKRIRLLGQPGIISNDFLQSVSCLPDVPCRTTPGGGIQYGAPSRDAPQRRDATPTAALARHLTAAPSGWDFKARGEEGPGSPAKLVSRLVRLLFLFFPLLSVIDNRPVVQLWSTAPPPCPPVLGLLLGCKPYSPTLPHISSHQTTPHRGPPVPTPVRRGRSPTGRASPAFSELRVSRACPKLLYTLFLRHSTTWLSGARIVPDGTADITFVEVLSRTVGATLA